MRINGVNVFLLAAAFWTPTTWAVDVDITAEFKPSPLNPGNGKFVNTTPCSSNHPSWCNAPGKEQPVRIFPEVQRTIIANGVPEDGVYLRTPGERSVSVTNERGETAQLNFRVSDIGAIARNASGTPSLASQVNNMGFPDNSGAVCNSGGRNASNSSIDTDWFWGLQSTAETSGAVCTKQLNTPGFSNDYLIRSLFVGYKLLAPDPLKLRSGIYRGEATYTFGPGGEFSVGNGAYSDSSITFRFALEVFHQFEVYVPAGAEKVVLTPPGGWADWVQRNQAPTTLSRDAAFLFTSSGPFTISLACQYDSGDGCGLKEAVSGDMVSLDTTITIPGVAEEGSGAPVNRWPLKLSAGTTSFETINYGFDRRSKAHFILEKAQVDEMMTRPGTSWRGGVTLVFDAQM